MINKKIFKKNQLLKKVPLKEHTLQKHIVRYLRLNGVLVVNCDVMIGLRFIYNQKSRLLFINDMNANGYTKGQADLIIVLDKIYFIELKTDKGKQTPEQKIFQEEVIKRGHKYLVWRSLDDAVDFLVEKKTK